MTLAPHGADLDLPAGARSLWIRHLHNDIRLDQGGLVPDRPDRRTGRTPGTRRCAVHRRSGPAGQIPLAAARRLPVRRGRGRRGAEQRPALGSDGGRAAFTEPDIHYLRGAWRLGEHEALLIEGDLVDCRHWNILLASRFLNSLDHRNRIVSRTAASSTIVDGPVPLSLAGRDPGLPG